MYNSTLLENLSLLSEEELKEFQLFVGSDLHNRGSYPEETRALIALIVRHFPSFNSPDLDKDRAYELILPGQPFIKSKLPKVMSEINQMLKDYVVWKEASKPENEFYHHLEWAKFMRNRGREEKYRLAFEKVKKYQQENNKESPEYFYRNYLMEQEAHEWQSANSRQKDDVNLLKTIDSLNTFYVVQLLGYFNHTLLINKTTNISIPDSSLQIDIIINLLSRKDHVLLNFLLKLNDILHKEVYETNDFHRFLNFQKNHDKYLSFEIAQEFHTYIRNLCTLLINAGNVSLHAPLFEIYRDNLEKGYLHHKGKINFGVYANIIRTAINQGEVDWAINFLEQFRNKVIGQPITHDYYYANKAEILFILKKFEESLDILPKSSKNIGYQIMVRRTEIKCYYEINSELLLFKMDAFKVYISRFSNKNLSTMLRRNCNGFVNMLYQIIQNKHAGKIKLFKIKSKILESSHLDEKSWLMAKVEDLINRS